MDAFMCYGPVVQNGYGVCYNPHNNYIQFIVTSFVDCSETKSDILADAIENALLQTKELIIKANHQSNGN